MPETEPRRVCVGVVLGAHGVGGQVRLKSFTAEPAGLGGLGPLTDESGRRRYVVRSIRSAGRGLVGRIDGVADRDAAEALKGTRLFVERAALPEPEAGAYYHADLVGLRVELGDGTVIGRVRAIHDFGAGDVIELESGEGGGQGAGPMVPFTAAAVPLVDIVAGRLVVDPPPGLLEPTRKKAERG